MGKLSVKSPTKLCQCKCTLNLEMKQPFRRHLKKTFLDVYEPFSHVCSRTVHIYIGGLLKNKLLWKMIAKFDAEICANFCSPKIFSSCRKITQILKSGITHMVTSNSGRPLHHHLWHSGRLSNSLFNRRTTKQTFTQWLQASTL
jgi:hypothetical protein